MASQTDAVISMRQFRGVNVAFDKVFIGADYLQASDNFVPDPRFRLARRRGSALAFMFGGGERIDALLRTYDDAGTRYLYAVVVTKTTAQLRMSVNDAAVPQDVGTPYVTPGRRYGLVVLGNQLYIGNGADPIRKTQLGSLVDEELAPLPSTDDSGHAELAVADPLSKLLTGTYSFAWAVYDSGTKRWVSRGIARTFTLSGGAANQAIQFTAPTPVLPFQQAYHLFLTDANAALESAHDQTTEGIAAGVAITIRDVVLETTLIPSAVVLRTGNLLVAHQSAIWFAGDRANPSRLRSTSTIIPGLEQAIFDIGDFFPALADEPVGQGDGDHITGIGVATLTSTQRSPSSPLAIFKTNATWLWQGGLADDPTAALVQISGQIGCIAQATIVATPYGLVFVGRQSVYLLPPTLQEPVDLGWPIAPVIRAIPPLDAPFACACYDKGFYRLCLTAAGGQRNATEWWLDMRQPFGVSATPSWWGPHSVLPQSAYAVGTRDPKAIDRTFAALDGSTAVVELDQPTFTEPHVSHPAIWNQAIWNQATWMHVDPVPLVARFRTAGLDDGTPLATKQFQRFRAKGQTDADTQLEVRIIMDEGSPEGTTVPADLLGKGAAIWNVGIWNQAKWGSRMFHEITDHDEATVLGGQANADVGAVFRERLLGQVAEVEVTHRVPVFLALRDCELRYLPDQRPVR